MLAAEGGKRTSTPAGVLIEFSDQGGGDSAFLFTGTDVRRANTGQALGYVKAPSEAG
jgi:hypothetical protein